MIDTLSFPRLSRAAECSGGYYCSLISPTPSPSAFFLTALTSLFYLCFIALLSLVTWLHLIFQHLSHLQRSYVPCLAHTNTLQPGFCPYIPLKQFSPSPANLIKTLLLSSDGFWIFIYFVDFGFCLFYYIPHFLKCISPKFRHSTSFPWFQLTLYPLGQRFLTGNVKRHFLFGTRSGQGRGNRVGMCVCYQHHGGIGWGYF